MPTQGVSHAGVRRGAALSDGERGVSQPCTETPTLGTRCWFLQNVQKGATLPDGGTGGVPSIIYFPFQRRKGSGDGWYGHNISILPYPLFLTLLVLCTIISSVIRSFANENTEAVFHGRSVRRFPASISRVALRKLLILDAAEGLDDLRIPPGNRLEKLKGDRSGQYSIRINDQWRICFEWKAMLIK